VDRRSFWALRCASPGGLLAVSGVSGMPKNNDGSACER